MLTLLLLFITLHYQLVYCFPHGGASCKTDWDCSLGGICSVNNNTCICDLWFTGSNCTYLNLAYAETNYGFQVPGSYSWGGHCAYDKSTNKYVGFFAFMVNHCELNSWKTNSEIVMSTADHPHGPYDTINYKPIIAPWSHNPYLVNSTTSNNINQWLIFHIGNGLNNTKLKNCSSNVSEISNIGYNKGNTETFYVEIANNSLYGPWNQYNENQQIIINETWVSNVSNPAPYIFENGTSLLYFKTQNCPVNWGLVDECIAMARSEKDWRGPYQTIGSLPIVKPESEDPTVFQDPRGNFHLLTNVNTNHKRCDAGIPCGGHAWSYDGITWSEQFIGAFGPVIYLKNGTVWNNSYVERPQVYQDNNRVPITFFVGMSKESYHDSTSWAQPFCTEKMFQNEQCGPTIQIEMSIKTS